MSPTTLYRWSAVALILGSLLGAAGSVLDTVLPSETAQQVASGPFLIDAAVFLAWSVLIALGLPGLYLRQASRAGVLGFTGFLILSLGVLLGGVGFATVQVSIFPYLAQSAPRLVPVDGTGPDVGFLLWIVVPVVGFAIGGILLGISTIRAAIFPRGAGALLMVAGFLFLLTIAPIPFLSLISNLAFFVAIAWYSFLLFSPAQELSRVPAEPAIQITQAKA